MTRADWVLVVSVMAGLPLLYARFWLHEDTAVYLRVLKGGGEAAIVSLLPDRRLSIDGPLGNSTIEIKAGQARFLSSPCPGKVCINTGWIKAAGELAACLPNRISIQLAGEHSRFDAINF